MKSYDGDHGIHSDGRHSEVSSSGSSEGFLSWDRSQQSQSYRSRRGVNEEAPAPPRPPSMNTQQQQEGRQQQRGNPQLLQSHHAPSSQQQQQSYNPTQQIPSHPSYHRTNSRDAPSEASSSKILLFRPMPPREFSLGSNLRRFHPSPMPTANLPGETGSNHGDGPGGGSSLRGSMISVSSSRQGSVSRLLEQQQQQNNQMTFPPPRVSARGNTAAAAENTYSDSMQDLHHSSEHSSQQDSVEGEENYMSQTLNEKATIHTRQQLAMSLGSDSSSMRSSIHSKARESALGPISEGAGSSSMSSGFSESLQLQTTGGGENVGLFGNEEKSTGNDDDQKMVTPLRTNVKRKQLSSEKTDRRKKLSSSHLSASSSHLDTSVSSSKISIPADYTIEDVDADVEPTNEEVLNSQTDVLKGNPGGDDEEANSSDGNDKQFVSKTPSESIHSTTPEKGPLKVDTSIAEEGEVDETFRKLTGRSVPMANTPMSVSTMSPNERQFHPGLRPAASATARFGKLLAECRELTETCGDESDAQSSEHLTAVDSSHPSSVPSQDSYQKGKMMSVLQLRAAAAQVAAVSDEPRSFVGEGIDTSAEKDLKMSNLTMDPAITSSVRSSGFYGDYDSALSGGAHSNFRASNFISDNPLETQSEEDEVGEQQSSQQGDQSDELPVGVHRVATKKDDDKPLRGSSQLRNERMNNATSRSGMSDLSEGVDFMLYGDGTDDVDLKIENMLGVDGTDETASFNPGKFMSQLEQSPTGGGAVSELSLSERDPVPTSMSAVGKKPPLSPTRRVQNEEPTAKYGRAFKPREEEEHSWLSNSSSRTPSTIPPKPNTPMPLTTSPLEANEIRIQNNKAMAGSAHSIGQSTDFSDDSGGLLVGFGQRQPMPARAPAPAQSEASSISSSDSSSGSDSNGSGSYSSGSSSSGSSSSYTSEEDSSLPILRDGQLLINQARESDSDLVSALSFGGASALMARQAMKSSFRNSQQGGDGGRPGVISSPQAPSPNGSSKKSSGSVSSQGSPGGDINFHHPKGGLSELNLQSSIDNQRVLEALDEEDESNASFLDDLSSIDEPNNAAVQNFLSAPPGRPGSEIWSSFSSKSELGSPRDIGLSFSKKASDADYAPKRQLIPPSASSKPSSMNSRSPEQSPLKQMNPGDSAPQEQISVTKIDRDDIGSKSSRNTEGSQRIVIVDGSLVSQNSISKSIETPLQPSLQQQDSKETSLGVRLGLRRSNSQQSHSSSSRGRSQLRPRADSPTRSQNSHAASRSSGSYYDGVVARAAAMQPGVEEPLLPGGSSSSDGSASLSSWSDSMRHQDSAPQQDAGIKTIESIRSMSSASSSRLRDGRVDNSATSMLHQQQLDRVHEESANNGNQGQSTQQGSGESPFQNIRGENIHSNVDDNISDMSSVVSKSRESSSRELPRPGFARSRERGNDEMSASSRHSGLSEQSRGRKASIEPPVYKTESAGNDLNFIANRVNEVQTNSSIGEFDITSKNDHSDMFRASMQDDSGVDALYEDFPSKMSSDDDMMDRRRQSSFERMTIDKDEADARKPWLTAPKETPDAQTEGTRSHMDSSENIMAVADKSGPSEPEILGRKSLDDNDDNLSDHLYGSHDALKRMGLFDPDSEEDERPPTPDNASSIKLPWDDESPVSRKQEVSRTLYASSSTSVTEWDFSGPAKTAEATSNDNNTDDRSNSSMSSNKNSVMSHHSPEAEVDQPRQETNGLDSSTRSSMADTVNEMSDLLRMSQQRREVYSDDESSSGIIESEDDIIESLKSFQDTFVIPKAESPLPSENDDVKVEENESSDDEEDDHFSVGEGDALVSLKKDSSRESPIPSQRRSSRRVNRQSLMLASSWLQEADDDDDDDDNEPAVVAKTKNPNPFDYDSSNEEAGPGPAESDDDDDDEVGDLPVVKPLPDIESGGESCGQSDSPPRRRTNPQSLMLASEAEDDNDSEPVNKMENAKANPFMDEFSDEEAGPGLVESDDDELVGPVFNVIPFSNEDTNKVESPPKEHKTDTANELPNDEQGGKHRKIICWVALLIIIIVAIVVGAIVSQSNKNPSTPSESPQTSTPTRLPTPLPPDNGNWVQVGGDLRGESAGDEAGFSVAVSQTGRVIMGARRNAKDDLKNRGAARIFQFDSNTGFYVPLWDIYGEAAGDQCGFSVSISQNGKRVAVGCLGSDRNGQNSGQVKIFDENESSNTWTLVTEFVGEQEMSLFGASVSLAPEGLDLVVGAPYYNEGAMTRSGRSYVYREVEGSRWEPIGKPMAGTSSNNLFGWSVSFLPDARLVAVGAPGLEGSSDSGYVKVFSFPTDRWQLYGNTMSLGVGGDRFGFSVSLAGDYNLPRVAIGAPGVSINGEGSGLASVFELELYGKGWQRSGDNLLGEGWGENLGYAVSLTPDASRMVVGVPNKKLDGLPVGQVQVLDVQPGRLQPAGDVYGRDGEKFGVSVTVSYEGKLVYGGATEANLVRVYGEMYQ